MQPFNRLTSYIEEYKRLVYSYYNQTMHYTPTTYYRLDDKNIVYDKNYTETYRNSGRLSGKHWYKLYFYPVFFSQAVQPTMNANERGVNMFTGTETSVVIDGTYGVRPMLGDIIKFNITGSYGTWVVSNIDYSAPFNLPFFKCTLSLYRLRDKIDNYLSGELVYIEPAKRLYTKDDARKILSCFAKLDDVISRLNELFDYRIGMHKYDTDRPIYFPTIDNILATNYKVANDVFPDAIDLRYSHNKFNYQYNSIFMRLVQTDRFTPPVNKYIQHTGHFSERVYNVNEYIPSQVTITSIDDIIDTVDFNVFTDNIQLIGKPNNTLEQLNNLWYYLIKDKNIGAFEAVNCKTSLECISMFNLLTRYLLILYNHSKTL